MKQHINLLGMTVTDKITHVTGIIESISFDLYGCVQAGLRRNGFDKDGRPYEPYWYDVKRLDVTKAKRVMDVPNFSLPEIGAADKPTADKPTAAKTLVLRGR